jgi:hypothetical protein
MLVLHGYLAHFGHSCVISSPYIHILVATLMTYSTVLARDKTNRLCLPNPMRATTWTILMKTLHQRKKVLERRHKSILLNLKRWIERCVDFCLA